jgi:hypothetical protein
MRPSVPTLKDTVDRFIESIEPVLPANQVRLCAFVVYRTAA